jgi:hypothetical protein
MMSAGKPNASITPAATLKATEAEQAEVCAHAKRKKVRRQAPRFAVDRQDGGQVQMKPAGVHTDAAAARLMNALGITDLDLAERLTAQIVNTIHMRSSNEPISAENLNAALAAVTLAAQMIGVHWVAMAMLGKAGSTSDRTLLNDMGNMTIKLLRTYTAQLEALKRYRTAGEQRVVVQHQHVNVTADRAAVQVNGGMTPVSDGRGALSELRDQPHAPSEIRSVSSEQGISMLCADPTRDTLSATGCKRAKPLPNARRR